MEFTAQQIADYLNGTVVGNPAVRVSDFSKIEEGHANTITFLANPKYEHYIYDTEASIVLVNNDFTPSSKVKATMIRVPDAYSALAQLLGLVEQTKPKKTGCDPSAFVSASASVPDSCYTGAFAYIGDNVTIGESCAIYPFAYIGDNVTIGDGTTIYPHVTVYSGCVIGSNCIIHAGAVIGADGFGFAHQETGEYSKIAQIGNVVIEDDVEIGANTAIDRAVMGSTVIRKGVKLDNLIQIAHNVEVGANTAMAAQVGIAGSTKVGAGCQLGGQVGLGGHITIGDNTKIGAQAGIISNTAAGSQVIGSPAMPIPTFMRASIIIKKLPEIYQTINRLEKEIDELKKEKLCRDKQH
ncbi:MAG: UDP-3-O-(3-hydroxymyristoyl)glucosamine N-acyltransferase [Tannerella sp.]|nr:UDP-3-O-(3-hydroxymyristoyl)glucosamine N-acyltransferase [Tannerella sp.]